MTKMPTHIMRAEVLARIQRREDLFYDLMVEEALKNGINGGIDDYKRFWSIAEAMLQAEELEQVVEPPKTDARPKKNRI